MYNYSSMPKVHLVKDHVVYVYWIDTVFVQNNLLTEFSKRTIFIYSKCYINIPVYFVHACSDNTVQFSFNGILSLTIKYKPLIIAFLYFQNN